MMSGEDPHALPRLPRKVKTRPDHHSVVSPRRQTGGRRPGGWEATTLGQTHAQPTSSDRSQALLEPRQHAALSAMLTVPPFAATPWRRSCRMSMRCLQRRRYYRQRCRKTYGCAVSVPEHPRSRIGAHAKSAPSPRRVAPRSLQTWRLQAHARAHSRDTPPCYRRQWAWAAGHLRSTSSVPAAVHHSSGQMGGAGYQRLTHHGQWRRPAVASALPARRAGAPQAAVVMPEAPGAWHPGPACQLPRHC
jgi:hypothetical protein